MIKTKTPVAKNRMAKINKPILTGENNLPQTMTVEMPIKKKVTKSVSRTFVKDILVPSHIFHPHFLKKNAKEIFNPLKLLNDPTVAQHDYMPDDLTKEHTKRMHFCAFRMHRSKTKVELRQWQSLYNQLRDQVVLGNRKLIYRAVRRRMSIPNTMDDQIGDCHIVLIQAVAVFNPWLGIRFSTYAYTCLVRALSRMAQKMAADWNNRAMPLDALPDGEPKGEGVIQPSSSGTLFIDEYLRDEHPLLNSREKSILSLRFAFDEAPSKRTLEGVGKALGLSKERVRQLQATAMEKLRIALNPQCI